MKMNGNSLDVVSAADFSVAHGGLIPVSSSGARERVHVRAPLAVFETYQNEYFNEN
ncbi:MAG: hypothetical protein ABSG23_17590 [Terriglobales bacterium]|jgi:predicted N-acetyltransferase YhbS